MDKKWVNISLLSHCFEFTQNVTQNKAVIAFASCRKRSQELCIEKEEAVIISYKTLSHQAQDLADTDIVKYSK